MVTAAADHRQFDVAPVATFCGHDAVRDARRVVVEAQPVREHGVLVRWYGTDGRYGARQLERVRSRGHRVVQRKLGRVANLHFHDYVRC